MISKKKKKNRSLLQRTPFSVYFQSISKKKNKPTRHTPQLSDNVREQTAHRANTTFSNQNALWPIVKYFCGPQVENHWLRWFGLASMLQESLPSSQASLLAKANGRKPVRRPKTTWTNYIKDLGCNRLGLHQAK